MSASVPARCDRDGALRPGLQVLRTEEGGHFFPLSQERSTAPNSIRFALHRSTARQSFDRFLSDGDADLAHCVDRVRVAWVATACACSLGHRLQGIPWPRPLEGHVTPQQTSMYWESQLTIPP